MSEVDQQLLDIVNNLDYSSVGSGDMSSSVSNPKPNYYDNNDNYSEPLSDDYYSTSILSPERNDYRQEQSRFGADLRNRPSRAYNINRNNDYNQQPQLQTCNSGSQVERFTNTTTDSGDIDINKLNVDNLDLDSIEIDDIDIDNIINKNSDTKEDNDNLDNDKNIPGVFSTLKHYIGNALYEMYPYKRKCKNKIFIFLIRLIQVVLTIFLVIGIALPHKLLHYHVIACILLLISYELFDQKNIFSLMVKNIGDYKKYHPLIPHKSESVKVFVLAFMFISIYGILVPNYSIFSLLTGMFSSLKKLN